MKTMLDYDRWANGLWLEFLEKKDLPEPDCQVFQHILAALEVWQLRCKGTSLMELPELPLSRAELDRLAGQWKNLLQDFAHNPVVSFRRTTGEALEARFHRIVRHVFNHGTYHRGELRGLCRARGDEDFPETDFSRYMFEAGIELIG
jgi:uncharacterized damage-inducible protein DinB